MMSLTFRQQRLLTFIADYQSQHGGVSPSHEEMQSALNLRSKSGVNRMLSRLQERGAIRRLPYRSRAIEIIEQTATGEGVCPHCGGNLNQHGDVNGNG